MPTQTTASAREEDAAILLQGEIADALTAETGLKPEIAEEWSRRVTDYLRRRLGTQRIYIPAPSRAARDAAIFREYHGTNAAEVCHRYGVSRRRLHEICAEQRALVRAGSSAVSCLKTGQGTA